MTNIQKVLKDKVDERERTIHLFASRPPRATFLEIRELDYQIAWLRYIVAQKRRSSESNTGRGIL